MGMVINGEKAGGFVINGEKVGGYAVGNEVVFRSDPHATPTGFPVNTAIPIPRPPTYYGLHSTGVTLSHGTDSFQLNPQYAWRPTAGGAWTLSGSVPGSRGRHPYHVTGLSPDTEYEARVQREQTRHGTGGAGWSGWSASTTFTTLASR